MPNSIGVLGLTTILAIAGLAVTGQDSITGREFVAAAKRGDENAVRKALDLDSTLAQATDAQDMTALDWAATREHWHIFRQLLAKGAPMSRVGSDGGTVLHRVAHYDRPDMLQLLIDAGGDITTQNQWGRTPLHVAARRWCGEVASLLIALGADLQETTNEGWTPLHVAYKAGQPDLVEILLAAGADAEQRDAEGRVPADYLFERPAEIAVDEAALYEYQGLYDVDENFHFKVWVEDGRHGAAYWRLATRWSAVLASFRPHFQDMENPREDDRCLLCHVTGTQDPDALFASTFDETEGIGCESCHGPGSLYMAANIMGDHEAFLAAGGRTPTEQTCRGCHRNPDNFEFEEWWQRIAHGGRGS